MTTIIMYALIIGHTTIARYSDPNECYARAISFENGRCEKVEIKR